MANIDTIITSGPKSALDETRIDGRVVFQSGLPAPQRTIVLYSVGFGGIESQLGKAVTDEQGNYGIAYAAGGKALNLEVRTVDAGGKELPLSRTLFNAASHEVINLVVPSAILPAAAEHGRLLADVVPVVDGAGGLGKAEEKGRRQDVTVLSQGTGWDGRLVALAALASKASPATEIGEQALYALFRVGLPTDAGKLGLVAPAVIEQALKKASDAGVVGLDAAAIEAAGAAFTKLQAASRRDAKPPGAVSTFGELIGKAGLDDKAAATFEELFYTHEGTGAELWQEAKARGLSGEVVAALQLQGKLAYLTVNNAELGAAVQKEIGSLDRMHAMVDLGLHRKDGWTARLASLAGGDDGRLAQLIPLVYAGAGSAERLDAYAEDMARKVRLAFPTRIVQKQIEAGEVSLRDRPELLRTRVAPLLERAVAIGFQLGRTPLDAFVAEHRGALFEPTATEAEIAEAVTGAQVVQRVYQISPTSEALGVLLGQGVTSARQVVAFGHEFFVGRMGPLLGSTGVADLVYRKAEQVTAVTQSMAAAASEVGGPMIYGVSPNGEQREGARDELMRQFPTLEALFGSLDFCDCTQCGSVLGPAAYFVDLLKFVDRDPAVWRHFLDEFRARHDGRDYERDFHYRLPYDALVARRPDLPNLPLTCENTHTELPYIDIVNEILEYDVAHGGLSGASMHDTGGAATADLVSEPQYVDRDAYRVLEAAAYPIGLPFDLWLETTRGLLGYLDTPLWHVLDALRTSDELFPPAAGDGAPYHMADVHAERLGLSPGERARIVQPIERWYELYGYADEATALAELAIARTLARRLSVSYRELADLVATEMVDPVRDPVAQALVLAGPAVGCDFAATRLVYGDGRAADRLVFARLNLFVRVWRKLGWSIAETDRALALFVPGGPRALTEASLAGAMAIALVELARLQMLEQRLDLGDQARPKLLGLWSGPAASSDELTARRSALARGLGLSVGDLARLIALAGDAADPTTPERTLHLVDIAERVAASGFSIAELAYLLRHDGRAIDDAAVLALVRELAAGLARIRAEHAIPAPELLGEDAVRRALALALPHDDAETLFAMFAGTVEYEVTRAEVRPADAIAPTTFAAVPALGVHYDDVRQVQHLTYRGVLVDAERRRIQGIDGSALVAALLDAVQARARVFLASVSPGLVDASDVDALFPPGGPPAWTRLAGSLFPFVERTLSRQLVIQTLASRLDGDPAVTEALVTDATLIAAPGDPPRALLGAFLDAARRGATSTTAPDTLRSEGYLEVPASGAYRFFVVLEQAGAVAELRIGDLPGPVCAGTAASARAELDGAVELKAGTAYRFTLDARALHGGGATLLVQGEQLAKGPLDRFPIYPLDAVDGIRRAYVLLDKALRLLAGFRLGEREARLLLADSDRYAGLSLSALPTAAADPADPAAAASARTRFARWLRVVDYVRLRTAMAVRGDGLIAVLEGASRALTSTDAVDDDAARRRLADDLQGRIAELARCPVETVAAVASRFGFTPGVDRVRRVVVAPDFADERSLWRLWSVLSLLRRLDVSLDTAVAWTDVVTRRGPRAPADIADDLRAMLKARLGLDAWRGVAQPIFDRLRRRKRDALVAYLVHRRGLERPEQLFEEFLIDPGMEPIVMASRLQVAIASVQLFIQRCLLNLELAVPPAAIDAAQWQWRKRYRVWEAGRKIFLYPENVLEPELRDDKTHLFRQLEATLLQQDASAEVVDDAFHAYLEKLDEIARLEIVSMFCEEAPADPAANVLHVIGRTQTSPRRYFYRRHAHRAWTAWEPVAAEIEGDHVVPVVWQHRTYLFWVTFLERTRTSDQATSTPIEAMRSSTASAAMTREVLVQLHWAERFQGAWTERRSTSYTDPASVTPTFTPAGVVVHVAFDGGPGHDDVLRIHLQGDLAEFNTFAASFHIAGKTSPPRSSWDAAPVVLPDYVVDRFSATGYRATGRQDLTLRVPPLHDRVLRPARAFSLIFPVNPTRGAIAGRPGSGDPFFYQDDRNTFFIQPALTEDTLDVATAFGITDRVAVQDTLDRMRDLAVHPGAPRTLQVPQASDEVWGPHALYRLTDRTDWVMQPATVLMFDDRLIGSTGAIESSAIDHALNGSGVIR